MSSPTPTDVLVRFEIAALGHAWRDEVRVTRTPLVDALIAGGRLLVLEETPAAAPAEDDQDEEPASTAQPVSWFAPTPAEG